MGASGDRERDRDRELERELEPAARPQPADGGTELADAADDADGRVERAWRDRPVLYAARHLIAPVAKVVLAAVGVGALLRTVLPRIEFDVAWLDTWGREHASWIPDPLGWVAQRLVERFGPFEVADRFEGLLQHARWWVPILVALAIGVAEVLRRWEAAGATRATVDGGQAVTDDADVEGARRGEPGTVGTDDAATSSQSGPHPTARGVDDAGPR